MRLNFASRVAVIGSTGMYVHRVPAAKAIRMITEGQATNIGNGKRRPICQIQLRPDSDFGTQCRTRLGRKYTEHQALGNGYFAHRHKRVYPEDSYHLVQAVTDCLK